MIKTICYCFFLFYIFCPTLQLNGQERSVDEFLLLPRHIYYRPLTYNDFEFTIEPVDTGYWHYLYRFPDSIYVLGNIPLPNDLASPIARSYVAMAGKYRFLNDTLTYCITSYFIPEMSYMRLQHESILMHEQVHFDICEYYALKAKSDLHILQFNGTTLYKVDSLIRFYEEKADEQNEKFDTECAEGVKGEIYTPIELVKQWHSRFALGIDSLKKYAKPIGSIGRINKSYLPHKK